MAGSNDDDPYTGKIEARDGVLKMYSRPRGQDEGFWVEISNFSIEVRYHSANKIENEGMVYIFQCQVQNGSQFLVPFNLDDLDTNLAAYKILKERKRPYDGSLNYEKIGKGNKGQLNSYLKTLVRRYQNSGDNRMPAIVSKTTGFVTVELDEQKLVAYVLGPECVLPTKQIDATAIRLLRKVWLGRPQVENFCLNANFGHNPQKFLDAALAYHGVNAPSLIAALVYAWLTLHMRDLAGNGIKIGICQVLGQMSTGKSSLRRHFEVILPRVKTHAGDITKVEQMLSVHMLNKKVTEPRWVLIQDPPTNDPAKMNDFSDCYYEGKVERTSASGLHSGDCPSLGLIFIWPNEAADLEKVNRTCVSKGFYLIHRMNLNHDWPQLENAWCQEVANAPALFLSLLRPIDMERLKQLGDRLTNDYHKELSAKYSAESLNEAQRLLQQYGLVNAAAMLWAEVTGFNIPVHDLGIYFTGVCLPYILDILESKRTPLNKDVVSSSPEEQIVAKLSHLNDHQLLENVGIYHMKGVTNFGFSLSFVHKSKSLEKYLDKISTAKEIKAVLHEQSELMWFKRTSAKGCNGHLYGKSNRKTLYICPVSSIPEIVKEALKKRLEDIIPDIESLSLTGNVEAEINNAFNKLYHPSFSGHVSQRAKLINSLDKLTDEEVKKVQIYTEQLVRKRKHESLDSGELSDEEYMKRVWNELENQSGNENDDDNKSMDGETSNDDTNEGEDLDDKTETNTANQNDETNQESAETRSPQQKEAPKPSTSSGIKTRSRTSKKKKN